MIETEAIDKEAVIQTEPETGRDLEKRLRQPLRKSQRQRHSKK